MSLAWHGVETRTVEKFPNEWVVFQRDVEKDVRSRGRSPEIHPRALPDLKAELVRTLQKTLDRLACPPQGESTEPIGFLTKLTARNITLLMTRLDSLEQALRSIREGKGCCTGCGVEIPLERLEAAGGQCCCVSCQNESEDRPS